MQGRLILPQYVRALSFFALKGRGTMNVEKIDLSRAQREKYDFSTVIRVTRSGHLISNLVPQSNLIAEVRHGSGATYGWNGPKYIVKNSSHAFASHCVQDRMYRRPHASSHLFVHIAAQCGHFIPVLTSLVNPHLLHGRLVHPAIQH